jgi:hypothetical protein
MTSVSVKVGEFESRRGSSVFGAIASTAAALVVASATAAWIANVDPTAFPFQPASVKDNSRLTFGDRFSLNSTAGPTINDIPSRSVSPSALRELNIKLQEAKMRLAQRLQSQESQTAASELALSPVGAVPLPKARPVEATAPGGSPAIAPDDRTLLRKFADLLPRALASLAPDGGLLSDGPDLAALGYDNLTAVYDISAHAVYMPNRIKLEAHSGFGNLMDDPGHVSERNVGATPPNVYDLTPRERLFHGIPALRMVPMDDKGVFGRSGLLAHSYMMGPNGDSNGCVSIKNYEHFLKAFQNGEVKRLAVVASLGDGNLTALNGN